MLRVGDKVDHCFVIMSLSESLTRGGKKYLSLEIKNKHISCSTKIWDWETVKAKLEKEIAVGGYVKLVGQVEEYAGAIQIKTQEFIVVDEPNMEDIVEIAGSPIEELEQELFNYIEMIENEVLREICKIVIYSDNLFKKFKERPAGIKHHHAVQGGLLEHTVSMMRVAVDLQKHYHFLSLDLLLAGCFWHDLGKVKELESVEVGTYTTQGRLIGHMSAAITLLDHIAGEYDYYGRKEIDLLKHMILSHHGKLEWGSSVEPRFPEALVLHFIDNLDAKLYSMFKELKDIDAGEWTSNRQQSFFKHHLFIDQTNYCK